jgi:2-polyprenyl-3-methyl-5-hydroxy-6-metoxy-1,4-benzoquinol methylase
MAQTSSSNLRGMAGHSTDVYDLLGGLIPHLNDAERKEYFNLHYWRFAETLKECTNWANGRVLDIGAVPGHMAMALRRLGCEVHGITNHEPSGSGRYGQDNLSSRWSKEEIALHYAVIDKEPLPLPNDFFDGVLFTEVLEHLVYDPRPLVQEIYRTLKANGEVVVSTPNVVRIENRIKILIGRNVYPSGDGFYSSNPYMRHNREYTMQEVLNLFCPPFRLKMARYINPYDLAVPVSDKGHIYDKKEYAEVSGGRSQGRNPPSLTTAARLMLRWAKVVYSPFRSCLLLSFVAIKEEGKSAPAAGGTSQSRL